MTQETHQEYSTFEVNIEGAGFIEEMVIRCKGVREDDGEELEYYVQDVLEVVSVKSGKDGKVYAFPNSMHRLLAHAKAMLVDYINTGRSIDIVQEC